MVTRRVRKFPMCGCSVVLTRGYPRVRLPRCFLFLRKSDFDLHRSVANNFSIFAVAFKLCLPTVAWETDGSNVGDILGTRNRCLGMVRKLLTDARETSYWILSSLLTAECSTIELPGSSTTPLFSFYYRKQIRAMTFRNHP